MAKTKNAMLLSESQAPVVRAVAKSFLSGLTYCAKGLWIPWVMATLVTALYGCGVGAMSLHQYPLAAVFYFVAIALVAWRIATHAKTTKQGGGAIVVIILIAGLALGGSMYWILHTFQTATNEPNLILRVAAWTWVRVSLLADLPWGWILLGFVIGLLLATFSHVTRTRRQLRGLVLCPDKQAHAVFDEDEFSIENRIRINHISYNPDFQKSHVDFWFHVFNNSLYDIVIDKTLKDGSFINYDFGECNHPRFQYPPIIESNKTIRCPSRGPCSFLVRQPIREEGLEPKLKTDDALIQFSGLKISFHVADDANGEAKTLKTLQQILHTKKRFWSGDDPTIIFGLTEGQWAAVQSGQVERLTEIGNLKKEIETLKEELQKKDEVSVLTGPDIIARKPYFTLVAKETEGGRYAKVGKNIPQHTKVVLAGFLDLFCQPTEGTVNGIDLAATITFKTALYERVVDLGAWHLRDNAKVPFRHNETQTLFLVLYDGTLSTYENQSRGQPIENPIGPELVYAHVRLFGLYQNDNKTRPVSINYWLWLSSQAGQLTADNLEEAEFIRAITPPK